MSWTHDIDVYVRFSETDAAGHVNNTSYFLYLEEARTKLFEKIEIEQEDEQSYLDLILASTTCDYLSQAYAGQTLNISTSISKIGKKSFSVSHEITEVDKGIAVARAFATMVCFNYTDQKTELIPAGLRKNLESKMVNHAI